MRLSAEFPKSFPFFSKNYGKFFLFLSGSHFVQRIEEIERDIDGAGGAIGLVGFVAAAVTDDPFEILARGDEPRAKDFEPLRVGLVEQLADRRIIENLGQIFGFKFGLTAFASRIAG